MVPYSLYINESSLIPEMSSIALEAFQAKVAPHYSENGIHIFQEFASPPQIQRRLQAGNHFYAVLNEQSIVLAMAETRIPAHLVMFFVKPEFQNQGIGRFLFERLVLEVQQRQPNAIRITVNSSPNSIEVYKAFGFTSDKPLQEKSGIQYLPMVLQFPIPPLRRL